jgi:hypothetical protein
MAYETNYTFMYGFSLLDDLHNFFPEILYDDTLFPDPRFSWFRHRTSTLFPSVFPRQNNMYRIYHASQRQSAFNTWVNSQTIGIQNSVATTPATSVPAPPSTEQSIPAPPTSQPSIQAGGLIGVNTIGQALRNANWDLRTPVPSTQAHNPRVNVSPQTTTTTNPAAAPNPRVTVSPWTTSTGMPATAAPAPLMPNQQSWFNTTPNRTYSQVAAGRGTGTTTDISQAVNVLLGLSESETEGVPTTPARTTFRATPTAPARRTTATLGSDVDILTALLTLPTQSVRGGAAAAFGTNDLLSLFTNGFNFQDVPVIPTMTQVNAGSQIIQHGDIPADENCAICQEHNLHGGSQAPWRRLNCSHRFHTSCIMPWFQRNVHCPVCRADVRDLGTVTNNTESDDNMTVSSRSSNEMDIETPPPT